MTLFYRNNELGYEINTALYHPVGIFTILCTIHSFMNTLSDGSTSKDFSFFRPPALDIQPVVDNQIPTVNVQSLPTVSGTDHLLLN